MAIETCMDLDLNWPSITVPLKVSVDQHFKLPLQNYKLTKVVFHKKLSYVGRASRYVTKAWPTL